MTDLERALNGFILSLGWDSDDLPPLLLTGYERAAVRFPLIRDDTPLRLLYGLAFMDGVESYHAQIAAILRAPEAKGREAMAIAMALDGMNVAEAIDRLRKAARADAPQQTVVELRRPTI